MWENNDDLLFKSTQGTAITYVNSLISDPRMFCAAQRFNQLDFGHYKKWVIDVDKMIHVPVTAHFMYFITKEKKMSVTRHSVVSDSEV